MRSPLAIEELGLVPYPEALRLQQEAVAARRAGQRPDTLFLLEHPPVVTLGRGARESNLLCSRDVLRARGVEVHEVSRGGDVTYHAPGQLVGYPVLDLAARGQRDVHAHLRKIEAALARALEAFGLQPRSVPGYTGVFIGPEPAAEAARHRKVASIGVGVRGWVTYHGFALNVDLDLAGFSDIVPCGLQDVEMTSIARELEAVPADLGLEARRAVRGAFLHVFG